MKLLNPGLDDMLDAPPDRNTRRRGLLCLVFYLGGWALQNYAAALSTKLAPRPLEAITENGVEMTDAEAGDGRDVPTSAAAVADAEYLDVETPQDVEPCRTFSWCALPARHTGVCVDEHGRDFAQRDGA